MTILKVVPAQCELKGGDAQAFEVSDDKGNPPADAVEWLVYPASGCCTGSMRAEGVFQVSSALMRSKRVTIAAVTKDSQGIVTGRGSAAVDLNPIRFWTATLGVYWIVLFFGFVLSLIYRWEDLCPQCQPAGLIISPPVVTLGPGQAQQFRANGEVIWSNTATSGGLYVAPKELTADQMVTVTATRADDPKRSASALIYLSPAGGLSVVPDMQAIVPRQKKQIALAAKTAAAGATIEWLVPSVGKIEPGKDGEGIYSVPEETESAIITLLARAQLSGGGTSKTLLAGAYIVIEAERSAACTNPATLSWRVIVLVALLGALGGLVHGIGSFGTYVGNRQLVSSWVWWYFLKPFLGAGVATLMFLVIGAGLGASPLDLSGLDCLKIAGFAGIVGLFAETATLKMRDIFEATFTPRGDPRGDKAQGTTSPKEKPVIRKLDPAQVKAGSAQIVKVMGAHFAKDCVVKVDGKDVTLESASSTELQFKATQLAAKKQPVVVYNAPPNGEASNVMELDVTP